MDVSPGPLLTPKSSFTSNQIPLEKFETFDWLIWISHSVHTANNDTYMSRGILTYSLYCNSNYNGINLVNLIYHPIRQNKRKMLKSGTPHMQTN